MRKKKVTLTIEKPTQCDNDCPLQYQGICFPMSRSIDGKSIPSWCPLEDCKKPKVNIVDFTRKEIEYYLENCNFSDEEKKVFQFRNKKKGYEEIAQIMNISLSTAKRIGVKINKKILKVIST